MIMKYFGNPLGTWLAYWGEGYMAWLFLGSLLTLFLLSIKNKKLRPLFATALMTTVIFFLPFTSSLMAHLDEGAIYWRLIWAIPYFAVIAAALTSLIRLIPKFELQVLVSLAALILIAICGKDQISAGNFLPAENMEQVPPLVVAVAENIREEGTEDCLVAADEDVASYLRVYAPDIKMVYGRRADGSISKNAYYLYQYMQTVGENVEIIPGFADAAGANCIVIRSPGENGDRIMETAGWRKTGEVDRVSIYRK